MLHFSKGEDRTRYCIVLGEDVVTATFIISICVSIYGLDSWDGGIGTSMSAFIFHRQRALTNAHTPRASDYVRYKPCSLLQHAPGQFKC